MPCGPSLARSAPENSGVDSFFAPFRGSRGRRSGRIAAAIWHQLR
jgi:hypothetical protein